MSAAGFDAPIRGEIRRNLWLKLWGNVCFNPISALTHATLNRITSERNLRTVCKAVMQEASGVSKALGVGIPEEMIDRRLAAAGAVGEHKMSMLQDLQRGQSMEIDALVTAVQELGQLAGIPTPTIDLLLTLVRERGKQAGLYSSLLKRVR
jgi:2-dehydropantoate 2-reductase